MNKAALVLLHRGRYWYCSLARRLHRMGDVEHAHSARIDVDVFNCRGWSGYGVHLDVLGDRADLQAASDVQATSQGRWHRIAGPTSRGHVPRNACVGRDPVRYLQFSAKLLSSVDTSVDGNLRR